MSDELDVERLAEAMHNAHPHWNRHKTTFEDHRDGHIEEAEAIAAEYARAFVKEEGSGLDRTIAEIRVMVADLAVTLDTPNPRLALQAGIETIDYWLAHIHHIASSSKSVAPIGERDL